MSAPLHGNLMENTIRHAGVPYEVSSPVTGTVFDRITLASKEEIHEALSHLSRQPGFSSTEAVFAFLKRLKDQIQAHRDLFFEKTYLETGFIAGDSMDIVDGTLEFLSDFEIHVREESSGERVIRHSYSRRSDRDMRITHRPFRCVAAVVPQNASLALSILVMASALYAGARVILRPSLQSGSTGALLAEMVMKSEPPSACISIVNSLASDFLDACCASEGVDLVHYIGSNRYAMSVLTQTFDSGKICLLDGQGNGILYLDDTFPMQDAVRIIVSGATRFNGETCTSINGVLVKESVYESLKESLTEAFRKLRVGHPLAEETQIGPLFSEKQAMGLQKIVRESRGARVLCGGEHRGTYFTPAVVEGIGPEDSMVREGFFGPMVWIHPIREGMLWPWLRGNSFSLSDTILSDDPDLIRAFAANSRAARICINEDPAVESMFEPWGGYPPSGMNPVSVWVDKYRQTFQLDGRLKDIMTIPTDFRTRNG